MSGLTHTFARPRRAERGFSVVEVLIAVLLLAAVGAAIALASAGGAQVRSAARLQAAMTAAGQQMQEDITTDRRWMTSCTSTCDVTGMINPDSGKLKDIDKGTVTFKATATAVDSDVDLTGANDRDGVVPDYFRLEIVTEADTALKSRYSLTPSTATRKFVTSIDRRGVVQVGSLAVEACRILNQSDERMTIQGCAKSGNTDVKMGGCSPSPRFGCVSAWNWVAPKGASNSSPSPYVRLQRVAPTYSFQLRNLSTNDLTPSSAAKQVDGLYVFQNLDAGEYALVGLPGSSGASTERWRSKEVPSYLGTGMVVAARITVEPGLRNRALMVFRPKRTNARIDLKFKREIHIHHIGGPFTRTEVVAPEWTPTDDYVGYNGKAYCDQLNARLNGQGGQFAVDSCGLAASPSPNCAVVVMTWHSVIDDLFGQVDRSTWCTFYSETYTHTYYRQVSVDDEIVNGAMETAVYAMEPKPDVRVAEPDGAGGINLPTETCLVYGHGTGGTGQCTSKIKNLWPGLNSSVQTPNSMLSGASNEAHAEVNSAVSGTPAWLSGAGIWVTPGGSIVPSSSGTSIGSSPSWTFIGDGECYWTSPMYSGKKEGSCNPCNPTFTTGTLFGACDVLTETSWKRVAIERDMSSGQEYPLPGAGGSFNWGSALPYKCSGPPVLVAGNCVRVTPPPDVPLTLHPTSSSGVARVKEHKVNVGPGKQ